MLAGAEWSSSATPGPAHLAAAVGTPVVSLFAPVVPAVRWRPWGVPHGLLGDQARRLPRHAGPRCPSPGIRACPAFPATQVVDAVRELAAAHGAGGSA